MFTGLVEAMGEVAELLPAGPGVRLVVRSDLFTDEVRLGDSIAINGCCLTVVTQTAKCVGFDAGSETLSRTNLGQLRPGDAINLERSLRFGDRLGGHLVTGHIDGPGELVEIRTEGDWAFYWFQVPASLSRQMASKGSVAVDGISLTLVHVDADRFSVALIPHTLQVTTLGKRKLGDRVNIETDLLAKYVERQVSAFPAVPSA